MNIFNAIGMIYKYWPLIEAALKAVEYIDSITKGGLEASVKEAIDHLTPGQPNSPSLGPEHMNELTGSPAMNQTPGE